MSDHPWPPEGTRVRILEHHGDLPEDVLKEPAYYVGYRLVKILPGIVLTVERHEIEVIDGER